MGSIEGNYFRHKISIPLGDQEVIDWIKKQSNINYSLRILIKDEISKNGIVDVTCKSSIVPSVGRPRKISLDESAEVTDLLSNANYNSGCDEPKSNNNARIPELDNNVIIDDKIAKSAVIESNTDNNDSSIDNSINNNNVISDSTNKVTDSDGFIDPEQFLNF